MSSSLSALWRRMPSPSITPNELLEILTAHNGGYYILPIEPYDEVFPGIFVGDSTTALCLHLLKRLEITHVLNAAWGKQRNLGMVNTSASYYRNANIEFMGIEALDMTVCPLYEHFYSGADFIDRALANGGKVLVHCGEGISRSSTLVLAYMMIKRGFRVQEAIRQVVKHRNILPNQGFLLQLCQLHDYLRSGSRERSPLFPLEPSNSTTILSTSSPSSKSCLSPSSNNNSSTNNSGVVTSSSYSSPSKLVRSYYPHVSSSSSSGSSPSTTISPFSYLPSSSSLSSSTTSRSGSSCSGSSSSRSSSSSSPSRSSSRNSNPTSYSSSTDNIRLYPASSGISLSPNRSLMSSYLGRGTLGAASIH